MIHGLSGWFALVVQVDVSELSMARLKLDTESVVLD